MKYRLFVIVAFLLSVGGLSAQKIVWKSSIQEAYWQNEKGAKWAEIPTSDNVVKISDKKMQVIDGLGGTFNEIGWDALCALPDNLKQEVIYNLFSTDEANFNFCRMPIGASDFGLSFYSLNDVPDDFKMINFNIHRDRYILIPYIKAAMKVRPDLKMWASPWAPPGWMKTNNHYASEPYEHGTNHNGLQPEKRQDLNTTGFRMERGYLEAYALYFTKFVQAYAQQGINIELVNIQNEPCSPTKYASCPWRPQDMAHFIGKYLGPKFEKENIKTEIYFGTINRDNPEFTRTALNDKDAAKYIKGVGFQWDGKWAIPHINKEYPHIKLMHTEAECGNGSNDWGAAENTWWQISHYMRNGVRVFTYWNMVLDHEGVSPWGWKQNALISVNKEAQTVKYNPEFYLMKHLCHYVSPGAYRLETPYNNEEVLAFVNPDGKTTILITNRSDKTRDFSLEIDGKFLNISVKAKSFNTLYF